MRHLARMAALKDAGRIAEQLLDCMSAAEAISTVAQATDLPFATVAAQLSHRRRQGQARARFARDRAIMRLARLGHTNTEIGAAVGLHPGSISRIIQSALRRR